ncbi:hypothetical protein ADL00_18660 [Streptomyces sp. AS58]|nr:hypothetical protein ADL00_18660 [Streptomyces sp. AS58]
MLGRRGPLHGHALPGRRGVGGRGRRCEAGAARVLSRGRHLGRQRGPVGRRRRLRHGDGVWRGGRLRHGDGV